MEGDISNIEEVISRSFADKPVRHTFDKKAFRRYSIGLLLWPLISLAFQLLIYMIDRDNDLTDFVFKVGLQALIFAVPLFSFLTMLYTLRGSEVFTAPGCVLYRKRRLFTSPFDGVRYIVYHIAGVKSVKGEEKHPAAVKGNINAVYVLEDGHTIHSYKTCRKVMIPPCFTDMEIIRGKLEDMETGTSNEEKALSTY